MDAWSPGPLEERVRDHPLVAQCVVVGNDRPYIAALVTLDAEAVSHWLAMRGKPELTPAELVRDPDLETEVRRAVIAANTLVSQAESIRRITHDYRRATLRTLRIAFLSSFA
ncbi:hypothetical protein ADL27_05065, partial [Streptomyces sp. NRRL F-6602]